MTGTLAQDILICCACCDLLFLHQTWDVSKVVQDSVMTNYLCKSANALNLQKRGISWCRRGVFLPAWLGKVVLGFNNIPSFCNKLQCLQVLFVNFATRHCLYILVTAPLCCNQRTWPASAIKLQIVVTSNNGYHQTKLLWLLVHATFI